jgi:hypothetical protein
LILGEQVARHCYFTFFNFIHVQILVEQIIMTKTVWMASKNKSGDVSIFGEALELAPEGSEAGVYSPSADRNQEDIL